MWMKMVVPHCTLHWYFPPSIMKGFRQLRFSVYHFHGFRQLPLHYESLVSSLMLYRLHPHLTSSQPWKIALLWPMSFCQQSLQVWFLMNQPLVNPELFLPVSLLEITHANLAFSTVRLELSGWKKCGWIWKFNDWGLSQYRYTASTVTVRGAMELGCMQYCKLA